MSRNRGSRSLRKSSKRRGRFTELLESRQLMAAHIGVSSFPTIQAAVNAANPGDTIHVDAGTYAEMVTINKPLTLDGAQANNDARTRSGSETIVTGKTISPGVQSSGFVVTASDVTINGFTVTGNTSSGQSGAGIVMAAGVSGTHVVNDIVSFNIAGLFLANASSTDQAVIQHNVFSDNNNAGNNNGRGIYSDGGVAGAPLTNVLIDGNTFKNNVGTSGIEAAIGLEAATAAHLQTNITISNNVMDSNGKGLLAENVSGLTIINNSILNSKDAGSAALRFEGNATNVTIKNNTIANNAGAAVRIDNNNVSGVSSGFVVTGNNLYSNGSGGLVVGAGSYTGSLNATGNYWGSTSGPSINNSGSGDALVANGASVTFSPFSKTLISGAGPVTPPTGMTPPTGGGFDTNGTAAAGVISLGTAKGFGVLGLAGTQINNSLVTIHGNEGVSTGGKITNMAPSSILGNVYEAATGEYTGPGKLSGSIFTNSALMTQVDADALAAAAEAKSLPATLTLGSVSGNKTITGNGGLNVIDINGNINLSNGSLMLTGTANDIFVVNVSGSVALVGSGGLTLGGGVTPNHVLYNFTSSSGSFAAHVGNVAYGTLLGPKTNFDLDGAFFGEIIGGGSSITLKSGTQVYSPPPTTSTSNSSSSSHSDLVSLVG